MRKRNLGKVRALVHEWGKWRRHSDSLRSLGYSSPELIPQSSTRDAFFAPEGILDAIDKAIADMRREQWEGYDLLRERFYYQQPLKDCATTFGITESKASTILDGLLSWIDGRIYSALQAEQQQGVQGEPSPSV